MGFQAAMSQDQSPVRQLSKDMRVLHGRVLKQATNQMELSTTGP